MGSPGLESSVPDLRVQPQSLSSRGNAMNRRQFLASSAALLAARPGLAQENPFRTKYFPLSPGIGLHDLAPAPDGSVWFTAQGKGMLGRLDPKDGTVKTVSL